MTAMITAAALQPMLAEVLILDVRKCADRTPTHLPGARWQDPEQVAVWAAALPRDRQIVVYCVHGHAVGQGVQAALAAAGYRARYLEGGLSAWQAAGGEVRGA